MVKKVLLVIFAILIGFLMLGVTITFLNQILVSIRSTKLNTSYGIGYGFGTLITYALFMAIFISAMKNTIKRFKQ